MIDSRNDKTTDQSDSASGEDRIAISDRRARRKRKRSDKAEDGVDDSAEDSIVESGVTAPKESRTRSRQEAQRSRERSSQGFGENLPIVGGIFGYFGGVIAEVRKVTWPTNEESQRLTMIVLSVTIAFSIVLGGIDLFYGWWFQQGLSSTETFVLVGIPVFAIAGFLSWRFVISEQE